MGIKVSSRKHYSYNIKAWKQSVHICLLCDHQRWDQATGRQPSLHLGHISLPALPVVNVYYFYCSLPHHQLMAPCGKIPTKLNHFYRKPLNIWREIYRGGFPLQPALTDAAGGFIRARGGKAVNQLWGSSLRAGQFCWTTQACVDGKGSRKELSCLEKSVLFTSLT